MPRHHATPHGNIPFTPAEEAARDAEVAKNIAEKQARIAAAADRRTARAALLDRLGITEAEAELLRDS